MRRLFTVLMFTVLMLPFAVFAQDQKMGWDLQADNYIDVQDLGFRFYFPKGWVYDLESGNGIALADTQASLDAQVDDDDSTQPDSLVVIIRGIPLEALSDLGENPTLEAVADFAVTAGAITESEPRVEVPIMTRRSLSVIGTNGDGRAGIASMWRQNGFLVLVSLGTPDEKTRNELAYTWGVTLGSIKPLDALDLGDGMLTDDVIQFTINYPDGWSPNPDQPASVYELEDDIGKGISDVVGNVFTFSDAALSDLQLPSDATLDDVVGQAKAAFDLDDDIIGEEFILLGQPAVTISAEPTSDSQGVGHGVILTVSLIDDRALLLILVTPSKEAADAFMPTWISMLSSVKSTKEPS